MDHLTHMKKAFLLFTTLLMAFTDVHAQADKLTSLQVNRYTRQGADVLVETGFLSTATKTFESVVPSLHAEAVLGIPASTLTAINGKFTVNVAVIDVQIQTRGKEYLSNFAISSKSYQVIGWMAYIVDFASGDDSFAPTTSLKVSKSKLTEGPKSKSKITVTLDKATTSDIVVRYKITGKAKINSDYQVKGSFGVINIRKGKKSGAVVLSLVDDKVKEKSEKLKITLLAGGQYKLGAKKKAAITILDNDK